MSLSSTQSWVSLKQLDIKFHNRQKNNSFDLIGHIEETESCFFNHHVNTGDGKLSFPVPSTPSPMMALCRTPPTKTGWQGGTNTLKEIDVMLLLAKSHTASIYLD
jgi:hypothetical protein